ncbi:MAG: hypothetical protein IKH15_07755 [Bacteroidales bacterium]|nr:hypothetical protein [Bacteroidales bacterium]
MGVTYKDIDQLTQKPRVSGTEKIPVSDTQYITSNQIAGLKIHVSSSEPTSSDGQDGDIWIVI